VLRALIAKELLALRRDPHALAVLFLMPAAFILVMSLALRDSFRLEPAAALRVLAVDEDASPASHRLLELTGAGAFNGTISGAQAQLRRREADVLLVVPRGFGAAVEAGRDVELALLAEAGAPLALLERERGRWERSLGTLRAESALRSFAALAPAATPPPAAARPAVVLRPASSVPLTSVQQSVPAWLVFAMFFVALPVSTALIGERQQGTLDRLRSLAVPPGHLVLGKLVPFFLVHQVQMVAMLAVGRWLVPLAGGDALSLDVNPLSLLLVSGATSVAALGLALLVASLARTAEQATIATGGLNIILGALGGVMVPKQVMPAAMQAATAVSPMAWGLDAFVDVFARRAAPGAVAPAGAALIAFGLVALAVGAARLRRAG
jgi:ABC-2 type transport system permease protein